MKINLDGMSTERTFNPPAPPYTVHICVPYGRNISKRISKDIEEDSDETRDTGKDIIQVHKLYLLKIMAYHK